VKLGPAIQLSLLSAVILAPISAGAHEGWGVIVDGRGHIYVTDIATNTVWRISPDGRIEAARRGVHSHSLSLGSDGSVFGTNVEPASPTRGVWRLDASGRRSDVIPATRGFPLDLQSFLRGPEGVIYSASVYQFPEPPGGRSLYLLRWSRSGAIDTIAGGQIGHSDGVGRAARFESIDGMAWLADGSMVVADGGWLRRVAVDGRVDSFGNKLAERRWDQDLMGVAVAPDGAMYAADFARRVVLRIRGDRVAIVYRPNIFWAPTGVAATANDLYVLEHPRAPLGILGDIRVGPYLRVRRISRDGTSDTLMTKWGSSSRKVAGAALALVGIAVLLRQRRRKLKYSSVA